MKVNKALKNDLEDAYKAAMSSVYRKHGSMYDPMQIKVEFLKYVQKHVTDVLVKELDKKVKPITKLNKIIKMLEKPIDKNASIEAKELEF